VGKGMLERGLYVVRRDFFNPVYKDAKDYVGRNDFVNN